MHGALTTFLSRKSLKLRSLSARPWSAIMRGAELLLQLRDWRLWLPIAAMRGF